ncbi:MAG TPA: electron transfer flavoprotein subunit beta/FixA family protein, partial [Rectinemataceae bacterium]|nr:electron transfer flavoprotein subunit beta/FixA family protein [Rectinemataceae bacterium]
MDILVAIKQVPDTDKVRMDPVTGTMVREGVDTIVNPLDLYAIELAIRLKEKHGGTLTAFTMGPPAAEKALKEAIAMGCDSGVLITDRAFSGSDTWATSYTLSRAVAKMGHYDLILAGERATDGDTGQVGPCLAAWLDLPVLTYVGSIEASGENSIVAPRIVARRLVEEGYQRVEVKLPCLLTVVKEVANPRLPTLRGKKFARQTKLAVYGAADLDADPGCPV